MDEIGKLGNRFPFDTRELIEEKLRGKGALGECLRCGNDHWGLVDGSFFLPFQSGGSYDAGGDGVALVGVQCKACGWLVLHVAATLGVGVPGAPAH